MTQTLEKTVPSLQRPLGAHPPIPQLTTDILPRLGMHLPIPSEADPVHPILDGQEWPLTVHEVFTTTCPVDQSILGRLEMISRDTDLARIAEAATKGFDTFRKTTWEERATILDNLALLLDSHKDIMTRLIALEVGKPVQLATIEVSRAMNLAKRYAQKCREIGTLEANPPQELGNGYAAYETLRPRGPVLAYTPFNFPLNLVMHKLAPAIGAGTSIVIKPSPRAPFTAWFLTCLCIAAGYSPISTVNLGNTQAALLVKDPAFKVFSFTGGTVGWELAKAAPLENVKILELGSNAPVILEDLPPSVSMRQVAQKVAFSAFGHAGQSCVSTQRVYVNKALYESFVSEFARVLADVRQGDIFNPETLLGPMISLEAAQIANARIGEALAQGATLLGDEEPCRLTAEGWLKPTALLNTRPEMAVNREELFAPVVAITPYETFTEGLALANDTELGLHAGVYTQSTEKALLAQNTLKMRGVNINEVPSFRDDGLPYGGIGQSGMGCEGVKTGIEDYCHSVYRVHNLGFTG